MNVLLHNWSLESQNRLGEPRKTFDRQLLEALNSLIALSASEGDNRCKRQKRDNQATRGERRAGKREGDCRSDPPLKMSPLTDGVVHRVLDCLRVQAEGEFR